MQKIPLELAAVGMKLAKPVVNKRGMTLCSAGTELTEELLERLKRMEMTRITVEGHSVDTGETEKSLGQQMAELDTRFRNVEGDPLMSKIKNIFLECLKERAEEA